MNQCDVPAEKLKKLLSFFDKIGDTQKIVSDIKKNRHIERALSKSEVTETAESSETDRRTVSCVNIHRKVNAAMYSSSADSEVTSKNTFNKAVTCKFCGENFDYR